MQIRQRVVAAMWGVVLGMSAPEKLPAGSAAEGSKRKRRDAKPVVKAPCKNREPASLRNWTGLSTGKQLRT